MEFKLASNYSWSRHIPREIDRDSWLSLPTNIEAEIQTSEVYTLMLRNLKTILEEAVTETEAQIKGLGVEAIKLSLKNLTRTLKPEKQESSTDLIYVQTNNIDEPEKNSLSQHKYQEQLTPKNQNQVQEKMSTNLSNDIEVDEQKKNSLSQHKYQEQLTPKNQNQVQEKMNTNLSNAIEVDEQKKNSLSQHKYQEQLTPKNQNQVQEKMNTNLSNAIEVETPTESMLVSINSNSDNTDTNISENNNNYSEEFPVKNNLLKWNKKQTKAEQAALELQERNTYLQELGKKLQKARKMRCLSIKQIHKKTFVPLHYLEAIEKGETEKLPEDVYLRGFIFRIGNALGFDGVTLAAELPICNSLQGLMPSWSKSNKDFRLYLHPAYLYVGYTALMAGAVSGLSWMSQQPSPGANMIPDTLEPPDSVAQSDQHLETTQTPGLKSTPGSVVVGSDMAPPETMI